MSHAAPDPRPTGSRPLHSKPHSAFKPLLVVGIALCLPAIALAVPNYRSAFFAQYPGAVGTVLDSVPSNATHCGLCHFNFDGGGSRNPYGERFRTAKSSFANNTTGWRAALQSIENEDSDGDGFSNLTEIGNAAFANTPTFPGLRSSNVGTVSHVTVSQIQPYLTPTLPPGDLNADGAVDTLDLGVFVAVLTGTDVDATHVSRADLNHDLATNGLDIQPFVAALVP